MDRAFIPMQAHDKNKAMMLSKEELELLPFSQLNLSIKQQQKGIAAILSSIPKVKWAQISHHMWSSLNRL